MKKISLILISTIIFLGNVISQTDSIVGCKADFTWRIDHNYYFVLPATAIDFYDSSNVQAVSWFWEFGDGNTDTRQKTFHIYNGYLFPPPVACLTITTADGCVSKVCRSISEWADTAYYPPAPCKVSFTPYILDTIPTIPEVIPYAFHVSAPKSTHSYHWDFGDSTTSEEAYPVHTYPFMGGNYQVCLTITTDDSCVSNYCTILHVGLPDTIISSGCKAGFDYQVMESAPAQYGFKDISEGNPTQWYWDFGDGSVSYEQNPVHCFSPRRDSVGSIYYPLFKAWYKVCLTITNDENCTSTYCDSILAGGITDTVVSPDCPYYISLSTSNILGGNYCSGSAEANLVDGSGEPVDAVTWFWSNGSAGPSTTGLCANTYYYVSITGTDGCQVMGSFAIMDYTKPYQPIGFWSVNGDGSFYNFNYNLPDSSLTCQWTFSDGTVMEGTNAAYDISGLDEKTVTVTVSDSTGKVIYSQHIDLAEGTGINLLPKNRLSIYPNPVTDLLHIKTASVDMPLSIRIMNTLGQTCMEVSAPENTPGDDIQVSVRDLPKGMYLLRASDGKGKIYSSSFIK